LAHQGPTINPYQAPKKPNATNTAIAIIGTQQAAIQSHHFQPDFFPSLSAPWFTFNFLVLKVRLGGVPAQQFVQWAIAADSGYDKIKTERDHGDVEHQQPSGATAEQ
jgi:hypothetical protein